MAGLPRLFHGDAESAGAVAPAHGEPQPRWPRLMLVSMTVLAVVLAGVGLRGQFSANRVTPTEPQPAAPTLVSATDVRARVSTALSSMRSLSGEVTIECAAGTVSCSPPPEGGRTTWRWSFVTTAAGDERITGIGRPVDLAHSAGGRDERVLSHPASPEVEVLTNLPAGSPDFPDRSSVLHRDLALVVRAFLDTSMDVPVSEVTEDNRPAWRLATPVVPGRTRGPGKNADQLEVVVDRQTGWPLRITETIEGQFLDEVRLSSLVVDGPVDPASFTIEVPAGAKTFPKDAGFVGVALGQIEAVVGYRPLLPAPASLPAGYKLAEVTVAVDAGIAVGQGGNAPGLRVVSVAYRRGFDSIVVTTRSIGTTKLCPSSENRCWADPVPRGEGVFEPYERFAVGGGALAGAQAELAPSPRGVPHVWTIDDKLVVTVAGDASAGELRHMIESFAPAS